MRVLFTHTDFRIYWPARLNALNTFLTDKGFEFFVVEIAGEGSPYNFAGENHSHPDYWHCLFPDKKMEEISASIANKALIRKLDELMPDIVFSGAIAFPSGAASVCWANKNRKKVVIFDDARLTDVPRSLLVEYIKKNIYSCVDAIFCPSPAWIDSFNHFGFNREQLFYGVDVVDNIFWARSEYPSESSPVGSKYFLTVGRQIPKKNFIFLLRSYNKYVMNVTDPLHLVFVGDGPEHEQLRSLVRVNDLNNLVHFYPFMSQKELKPFYHNASWFILPSRFGETWGLVVNEAMASGLPVLVSEQVGCASSLVKEGENGYTFSPEDENELSGLLFKMGNLNNDKRKDMGLRSMEIINEWGLDRFFIGAFEAIKYVSSHDLKKPGLISRLILKLWKGRYRPV